VFRAKEQEQNLELAIRDIVVRDPLISVVRLQNELKERKFKTAQATA
jgi:hypothetical protein